MNKKILILGVGVVIIAAGLIFAIERLTQPDWTTDEVRIIESLWIGNIKPLEADPSNAYGDNPTAAALGEALFNDTRFSANGAVSCASCHNANKFFQDNLPRAIGVGVTGRSTPTIIGTAYSPWQFWDGRKDSQWAQALGPMESTVEHGGTRTQYAHLINEHYREAYENLFGALPNANDFARYPEMAGPTDDPEMNAIWESMNEADRTAITQIYVNMGKAIAAFERTILPKPSRFDAFAEALISGDLDNANAHLSADEKAGLKLFISTGRCTECHNSPLFTNNDFSAIGTPPTEDLGYDPGRSVGRDQVQVDEFNCLSVHSDAEPDECEALRFLAPYTPDMIGSFKTPTLRNIANTAPYMHSGQFETLEEVMEHYNEAPPGLQNHTDLVPLDMTTEQLNQIVAFLKSLTEVSPPAAAQQQVH